MSTDQRTITQLDDLIKDAKELGFYDDVARWTTERRAVERAQCNEEPVIDEDGSAPSASDPAQPEPALPYPALDEGPDPLIVNPPLMGWPWESPDGVLDDPLVRIEEIECGCYQRIDHEAVLCSRHLAELNDQCSFQPETWGEWPGIAGMVMLCNTHGRPGVGVYDFPDNEAVGTCDAVEDLR